jgi:hypothetical protein
MNDVTIANYLFSGHLGQLRQAEKAGGRKHGLFEMVLKREYHRWRRIFEEV